MSRVQEITALAEQRLGLAPRHRWDEHLRREIKRSALARGISQEQLLDQIKRNPGLFSSIVGTLTVGESYFFRHPVHFEVFVAVAQRHLARSGESFHVWSAGCAGGEEPYSAALALRQKLPVADLARVSILATDVNATAIARAVTGVFPRWAFREVSTSWLDAYFSPRPQECRVLCKEVRQQVTFRHTSLQDQLVLLPPASKDVIFFRNVSVYLKSSATDAIYRGFSEVLRPGGLLFVSPTDVRPLLAEFQVFRGEDSTIFERRGSPECGRRAQNAHTSSVRSVFPVSTRVPVIDDPPTVLSSLRAIDEAADRGDLLGALALLAPHFECTEPGAELYERRGRLRLALGHALEAVQDYRRVLYLEPTNYSARYWYALALRQVGKTDLAKQQLQVLAADSRGVPEDLRSSARSLIGALR